MGFEKAVEMGACRLRRDSGHARQLSRRQGAAIGQRSQDGCAGGIADQRRGRGNVRFEVGAGTEHRAIAARTACRGKAKLPCTSKHGRALLAAALHERRAIMNDRRSLEMEHIYHAWDEALGRKDADAALALYAPDAILESPLVRHLLGSERGILLGRDELRPFFELVSSRTPPARKRHRTGLFTDGEHLLWEYPRVTPHGEQMDLVEVMNVRDGLIQHHRVYWGWLGLRILEHDGYRR